MLTSEKKREVCSGLNVMILFMFLALTGVVAAGTGGGLSVRRTQREDETLLIVSNAFYEVSVFPAKGAVITSLRSKPGGFESTYFREGDFSGLLQEVHTAELPYEIVEEDVGDREARFLFSASTGDYGVEKMMLFRAESPFVEVRMGFENRSAMPMRGDRAPALSNVFKWGDGAPSSGYFYCIGGPHGTDLYTGGRVIGRFHPFSEKRSGHVPWAAVIDPVARAGAGLVFLDSGVENIVAGRNSDGSTGLEARFQTIPSGSRLISEMLLLPLEGFTSVDMMSAEIVGETLHLSFAGREQLRVRIMSLMPEEHDISVVTRAYDQRGEELGPLETVVFDGLERAQIGSDTIDIEGGRQEDIAWVRHEVYKNGRRLRQYSVKIGGSDSPPDIRLSTPEEPTVERLRVEDGPDRPDVVEDADRSQITVRQLSGPGWEKMDGMDVSLPANSRHTLLLRVDADAEVRDLQIGIVGAGSDDADELTESLTATNVFLWEVKDPRSAYAGIRPFRKRDIDAGEPAVIAITLDSAGLGEGVYGARILLSSVVETVEIPLKVRIFPVELSPSNGFGLWYIGGDVDEISDAAFATLRNYGVNAAAFGITGRSGRFGIQPLKDRAMEHEIAMPGLYSPGMAAAVAERIGSRDDGDTTPASEAPVAWMLCMGADGTEALEHVADFGFAPAVFVSRLSPAVVRRLGEDAADVPHLILGGDIPSGRAQWLGGSAGSGDWPHIWRYIDLRSHHWTEVGVGAREEFFNALLSGAGGAAVRFVPPTDDSGDALVSWHLLRDIREEAALLALAREAVDDPDVPASLRDEFSALISGVAPAPIMTANERGAFGQSARLSFGAEGASFAGRRLRRLALEILSAAADAGPGTSIGQ